MRLFTIGFTKKTAEEFFTLLIENKVKTIVDIRRNNKSQLAGFTKEIDLKFFLKGIANIKYIYLSEFAPDEELFKNYRSKKINWVQFEEQYLDQIKNYGNWENFDIDIIQDGCLLCSESSPSKCHRRLLAEFLLSKFRDKSIQIVHL